MAEAALGTDTGASVRLPAALNGITGLRPTAGAVSNGDTLAVSPQLDTTGPMARSVDTVARVFAVVSAFDPDDPASAPRPRPDVLTGLEAGVKGLRILLPTNSLFSDADPGIPEAVESVARELEAQGARLVRLPLPDAGLVLEMAMRVAQVDAAARYEASLTGRPELFSEPVRHRLTPGLELRAVDYVRTCEWLASWRLRVARLLDEAADLVLTPTTPCTAPPKSDEDLVLITSRLSRFLWIWPAARMPALSLPCGLDALGLPIGAQLAAARWQELLLFRAGHAWQRATDWHLREPRPA
jgi:aspartyl-tRNA(Asn)/glutamyl-tRNA(Gln) amidotransferase subunit A